MSGHDHTDQAPERQIRRGIYTYKKEKKGDHAIFYGSRLQPTSQPPHTLPYPQFLQSLDLKLKSILIMYRPMPVINRVV
jgi:hypothetical protein